MFSASLDALDQMKKIKGIEKQNYLRHKIRD